MRQAKKTLVSVSVMLAAAMALPFAGAAFAQGEEFVEAEVVESEDAQEPVEVEPCLDASCDEQAVEAEEAPAPVAAEAPVIVEAAAPAAPTADGAVLSTPGGEGSEGGGSTRPGTTPDD
jgi:hypothetical protein